MKAVSSIIHAESYYRNSQDVYRDFTIAFDQSDSWTHPCHVRINLTGGTLITQEYLFNLQYFSTYLSTQEAVHSRATPSRMPMKIPTSTAISRPEMNEKNPQRYN